MGTERAATLIERPAEEVWSAIREFGDLSWFPGVESCTRVGDTRAIRMKSRGFELVERLVAHDDDGRTYTYCVDGELDLTPLGRDDLPASISGLQATMTVEPKDAAASWVFYDVEADEALVHGARDGYQRAIDNLKALLEAQQ